MTADARCYPRWGVEIRTDLGRVFHLEGGELERVNRQLFSDSGNESLRFAELCEGL
jgi:hypothetical protein